MVKIQFCLRRLPPLSSQEFRDYWYDVHAPLVRKHQEVLRISRYVQFHTEFGPVTDRLMAFRKSPEPYDGVAEIWYENCEALETLGQDASARAASRELRDDEARFVDLSRSPIWLGEERLILVTFPRKIRPSLVGKFQVMRCLLLLYSRRQRRILLG